jgi:hypothetical protein
MAEPTIDIELVVREVLRALGASAAPPSPPVPLPSGTDRTLVERGGPDAGSARTEGQLVVSERVVTLAQLDGRLSGVKQVVVPPQAIVTPAVHDELARRNVTLTFASDQPASPADALRLVVVAMGTKFDPARLVAALKKSPLLVVPHTLDCVMASCDLLAHQIGQAKTLGLLLTRYTPAALCLANRLAGVRAVTAADAATVRRVAKQVGANLLVVDPEAGSLFALRQMVMEFCRDGVRQCPEVFLKRLG